MITSPNSSVKPEQELARLTLISSTNEAAIRRRSTISGARPTGLGDIDGRPVIGPLGPPQPVLTEETGGQVGESSEPATSVEEKRTAMKETPTSDADSEATLVSEASKTETGGSPTAGGKENLPPAEEKEAPESRDPVESKPENSQSASGSEPFIGPIGPPNRPPPVPPRPSQQVDSQKLALEEVEIGAQQDVTEVINNLLFQTQCAIKPNKIDADGEQLDLVKE